MSFTTVMIVSMIIIIIVIGSTIITTNSAYKYEHKVDPIPKAKEDLPQDKNQTE
ncbi:YtzI protein [Jeotgalibacillus marinus]|uniref:YtzI protein n=1 Tax=Jeotgalibacillus marinus TaxID=86667 RepID=A0ABV3Q6B7_9BACL